MRNLLQAADRDRLVRLLAGPLLREVRVGGRRLPALAEGEGSEGGGLCAAAANARAAELLLQPEVRAGAPALADGVLDFVRAMQDAPVPCRAAAAGGIEVTRADPRDFEVVTPFHRFSGDLGAGMVKQQLRGPAGLSAGAPRHPAIHSGNMVEFRIGRHRVCLDVEEAVTGFALERDGDGVVLSHTSTLRGRAGWLAPREVEAGTVTYRYAIAPDTPVLRLTVTFRAAHALSRLRLTTALDGMDMPGLELAEASLLLGGAWKPARPTPQPGLLAWTEGAALAQLSLGQAGWPAGAPTLHLRPAEPARVMGAKVVSRSGGLAHWLVLRHGPVDLPAGGELVVREDRLLAAGTGPEAAAAGMTAGGLAGLDLEPAPPEPAALTAVATALLHDAAGGHADPLPEDRRADLAAWLERRLRAVEAAGADAAALAHAIMAAEAWARAGGAGAALVPAFAARLAALQTELGAFREAEGREPRLVPHALALLALARAGALLDARRFGPVVEAALGAIRPGPVASLAGGRTVTLDGIALAGAPPAPIDDHAEGVALATRAAGAVALAAAAGAPALSPDAAARAEELHRQGVALLRPLVRARGMVLEVAPSPLGGAAGAVAQSAATLALMCPEAVTMALPFPAPAASGA
ncbi:hypothetical protein [Falsiroseomonas sp. CW058]|uniref:hypothetical protein n=1 Tax=Falsiroseomonas sp. CW058 TaxID=3388664 RepID=UPI003D31E499